MSITERPRVGSIADQLAANRLGVMGLLHFALTAATPLTVVAAVTVTGWALSGQIGIPVAFAAIGAVLILFSVGYTTMARHISNAGAFYAFAARGVSPVVGVSAALVALVAYAALSLGLYGLVGASAVPLIETWTGWAAPWWVPALGMWLLVSILGTRAVDLNSKFLAVLLSVEMALIIVFSVSNLGHPLDGTYSLDALDPSLLVTSASGAVLVLGFLGMVGVEMPTVYSEESKNPRRTVRIATVLAIVILAVLYTVASWSMTVAVGPDAIVAAAAEQGPGVFFGLIAEQMGTPLATAAEVLLVTSVVAAAISFHNTVSRYAFALGREHVLPPALGRTSPATGAPFNASLIQSGIALLVLAVYAIAGLDPMVDLFFLLGTAGGVGILMLITVVSAAVVKFFAADRRGESAWSTRWAPALSTLLLLAVTVMAVVSFADLLGVAPDSPVPTAVLVVYAVVAAAGIVWGLVLRSSRPDLYRRIGAGPQAVVDEEAEEGARS
ncbi:APC family permease [Glycomyces paridis]|uniref:APC family permease n=1 Tax=Glycomyces paridis TaxID=2126555 RepID=A0A4S8P960_9ACTN|nr:APC family permease [Glycomyces paridis]THV26778.1 APC family permease [Glycomyces paridis]